MDNKKRAFFLGYNIKESFTGNDGKVIPERYQLRFLDLETLEYLTFQKVELPKNLAEISPVTFDTICVGDLELELLPLYVKGVKGNAFRQNFRAFTNVKPWKK